MMPAATPEALAERERINPVDLIEALAVCLEENDHRSRRQQAAALLAGPFVPVIAEAAGFRAALATATAEAASLRAEVAELREALKPFAEAAEVMTAPDCGCVVYREYNSRKSFLDPLEVGHFRAARTALARAATAREGNSPTTEDKGREDRA